MLVRQPDHFNPLHRLFPFERKVFGNLRSMAREGAIDGGSSLTFLALFFVNYEPHLVALALPKSFNFGQKVRSRRFAVGLQSRIF